MVGHMRSEPQGAEFQIIVKRNGLVQRATDLPLKGSDIARVGFEAAVQNLGMAQLMAVAVTTAIKRDLIDEILRAPTQLACATGPFQCGQFQNEPTAFAKSSFHAHRHGFDVVTRQECGFGEIVPPS
jgi:hypothetical protein